MMGGENDGTRQKVHQKEVPHPIGEREMTGSAATRKHVLRSQGSREASGSVKNRKENLSDKKRTRKSREGSHDLNNARRYATTGSGTS